MSTTLLTAPDDLQWLKETHLKDKPRTLAEMPFVLAILHGNEDCPERIELYKEDDYRSEPAVFVLVHKANGGFAYALETAGDFREPSI